MTNPTDLHDIIFVTDKYGRRNKTGDIEKLQYDSRKDVYYITYKDGKTYPCRSADLQIIKNCLKDKQSAAVFDYLLQMAQFSDIKNDEGQNLLVKNLEKSKFINEYSVLARYLNPKNCKDHYNQRQIDVIKEEILPKYSEDEIANLGIIAPYNNQTDAIRFQIPGIDAATVHKYQGREKDNIIISTVDNEITSFADDANMLNVAISRAKKKLAVVLSGNEQPENSNLVSLLKYIQYNNFTIEDSKVNSIFDFFYTKETEAKFKFLKAANKISKYDSENAMNALLTNIFEEPKYSKFSFVFEMPLKDVVNKNYMGELPEELSTFANRSWAHVDFTVFNRVTKEILFGIEVDGYNYHKKGTRQVERDLKKNAIFDQIGLPLLRLSTKGSGEEGKIKAQLDKYLGVE